MQRSTAYVLVFKDPALHKAGETLNGKPDTATDLKMLKYYTGLNNYQCNFGGSMV